ncbi:MAG: ABC transporter permease [Chloroflexi bacterium]|nr:ABC transporter permease [Chloroflexota bacterium]
MKSIIALYLAQAKESLRDRSTLLFVILLPIAFAIFFGLAFSGGGGFTLQLGVANEDAGAAGAEFVKALQSPETAKVMGVQVGSRQELLAKLDKTDLHVVVVLPSTLSVTFAARQSTPVQVYFDPTRQTSALGLQSVRILLDEANLQLAGAPRLFTMSEQTVQSHPPRTIDFYMAGMLGVALLWLGVFGVAQPIVAQRDQQILRRIGITAITRAQLLVAEASWRMSIGLLQAAIFLVVGYFGFQVVVANWLPFAGAVLLGTAVFVSFGYVIAGIARTSESAMAIAQLLNFPMMMLSGSIFPAEMLPDFFKPIVNALPLTYLSDLLRQTMVGAAATNPMALDFAVLGGWLIVLALLAAKLWKWE